MPEFRLVRLIVPALGAVGALILGFGVISGSFTSSVKSTAVSSKETGPKPDGIGLATYRPGAVACLAEAVYYETLGTSERAAQAVAHVVLNRREHDEFPETVCAVVTEGCQFSYRCDGKPETLSDDEERERAFRAAGAVLEGHAADPTDGALFFHSEEVPPGWFETRDRTIEIGGNIFYR
jgi:spore germination cell wall hydrolase CwlJ-like protein